LILTAPRDACGLRIPFAFTADGHDEQDHRSCRLSLLFLLGFVQLLGEVFRSHFLIAVHWPSSQSMWCLHRAGSSPSVRANVVSDRYAGLDTVVQTLYAVYSSSRSFPTVSSRVPDIDLK